MRTTSCKLAAPIGGLGPEQLGALVELTAIAAKDPAGPVSRKDKQLPGSASPRPMPFAGKGRGLLSERDSTVDALRGVAALLVVVYHICDVLDAQWFHSLNLGRMGVQLFFVISGFVIGALLIESNPGWAHMARFLGRRMARLAPPYSVATLGGMVLFVLFKHFYPAGHFLRPSWEVLLCSLTYTCYPLGLPAYVEVSWTLELEVQFYLVAVCLMPLVVRYGARAGWPLSALLLVVSLFVPAVFALNYAVPFLLGMAIVAYRRGGLSLPAYLLIDAALAAYWGWHLDEPETGATVGLGAAAIALGQRLPAALRWLGSISYSLYLVHVPFGVRALSTARKLHVPMEGPWLWWWCIVAIANSIFVAYLMHRFVEKPAIRWSRRIGPAGVGMMDGAVLAVITPAERVSPARHVSKGSRDSNRSSHARSDSG